MNNMATLLEQAKEVKLNKSKKSEITEEKLELALAYIRGEIAAKQVKVITGQDGYFFAMRCLLEAYRNGWLVVKK